MEVCVTNTTTAGTIPAKSAGKASTQQTMRNSPLVEAKRPHIGEPQDDASGSNRAWTIPELIDFCARLQPTLAAQNEDSALAVTPLITQVIVDGKLIQLGLVNGKWGAGYPRVSDLMQRSAKSWLGGGEALIAAIIDGNSDEQDEATDDGDDSSSLDEGVETSETAAPTMRTGHSRRGKGRRRGRTVPDGYSEEEQLNRQIRYFVRRGQAFRIYSDCGITGEYPTNNPDMIVKLLASQASRYQKIFRRTMLDETSRLRYTSAEIDSMEQYVTKRVMQIKRGTLTDEEIDESEDLCERAKRRLRSRKRKKAYFRQALTQLWQDIEAGYVHTVAVSDRSRLCRSADMETMILQLLCEHEVRLVGLIEDLSSLDVSDPMKRGLNYLIGSVNEYRLEELAGHAFRGVLQLLESGRPNGRLPWWLERDDDGKAVLINERGDLVRQIVQMSLSGMGIGAITNQLHADGICVKGKSLTRMQILYLLQSDALAGMQHYFGLAWPVYVRVVDDETMAELRQRNAERARGLENLHNTATWAEHPFTGLLRCNCGTLLSFNQAAPERRGKGDLGYYRCKSFFKTGGKNAPAHGSVNELKLLQFFGEIFRENPNLIAGVLTVGSERLRNAQERQVALEQEWRIACEQHEALSTAAQIEAEAKAAAIPGVQAGSTGYAVIVDGLRQNILEEHTKRLSVLRQEMVVAAQATSRDRTAVRALEAIDSLKGWDDLDDRRKNRLMRVLFAEITVYPLGNRVHPGCGGYLEIKLAGNSVPLPPVRLRRGPGRGIFFPSAAEWIADSFRDQTEGGISDK